MSARTKIVYLANPNNPTGTYIPFSEVKRLHEGLPPHALLVIDAAYAEYVTRNDYAAGVELASAMDNVVMTRTSPSPWAGVDRLGLDQAHVVDALNRVRGPFNLNGAAQIASHSERSRSPPSKGRSRTTRAGCPGWPRRSPGLESR